MTATTELTTVDLPLIKTDRLGRIRISREHREQLLDAFEQSAMSGMKFANHCGVKYSTFASWIQKRRRDKNQYPSPPDSPSVSLTEVEVAIADTEANLTVNFPSGASIHISTPGQVQLVAALLTNLNHSNHA